MNELIKCKNDPIYFFEKYCILNNKRIKLKDYQINFIKKLLKVSKDKQNNYDTINWTKGTFVNMYHKLKNFDSKN